MEPAQQEAIEILPFERAHLPQASTLFDRYPFKAAQRHAQQLPVERLVRFYTQGLERDLDAGRDRWIALGPDGAVALGGINADEHHSVAYGMAMGKIAPWLTLPGCTAGRPLLRAIGDRSASLGFEHLSVRLDGEDYPSLHLFESFDFHLIDVSLKFFMPFPAAGADWPAIEAPRVGWTIRRMNAADAEWMIPLGGGGHGQNHFLNDPHLDPGATSGLFSDWVRRCIEGLAYAVYVLEDPSGQGRGFVTYLRNQGFSKIVGRNPLILDYVILDPRVRGGGLGPWLIHESLYRERSQGFDFCELRTSQHNHRAVIGYEKLGFRLCATDFILHRKM